MSFQKISFVVPPGLWESFAAQANTLFLNRAPFLNHMISKEIPELTTDLAGRRLSTASKRYISGLLKKQGAKSVNIEIETQTAQSLNYIVDDFNLVRSAFLCRLIIFLRSSDALLRFLDVPTSVGGRILSDGLPPMPSSPMKAMEEVRDDPLYYIRHHVRENHGTGIYGVQLPRELDWCACFLEEKDVPGTRAFKEEQRASAELFELFENNAFKSVNEGMNIGASK